MHVKMLYWMGCMSRLKMKNISDSTMELLRLLNIPFETLGPDEGCCGSILLRTGQPEDARRLAIENIALIKSKGYQEVVTSCPGCFKTMSSEYSLFFRDIPFKAYHISQLLVERADELKKHLLPLHIRVVYHDPCHLGRSMGVYEEPRTLIKLVPGVELVEFKYNRSKALCCGSGGGVRSAFPELSTEVAKAIIREPFKATGAQMIVTSCPFCNYNFRSTGEIEVVDLPEFLLKSWRSS
jgi:heterodisulfide reductase subunit D